MTWRAWAADVPRRIAARWRFKATLALSITVMFCAPYFLIGHFPLFPVRRLPLTAVDRLIGFHPYAWVWVYQSIYLLMNVVPWLATRASDLRAYTRGFALVSMISFAVFLVFPIQAPKPVVSNPTGMYRLLLSYDAPLNSLPSLHASLLVYTLCFGRRILPRDERPAGLATACAVWAGLVLYGTLATKEHYLVDIVSGAALATCVDAWVWRARGVEGGVSAPELAAARAGPLPAER